MKDKQRMRIRARFLAILMIFCVAFIISDTTFAANNVFSITNVTLGAKSDTVTGSIESFDNNEVKSSVAFRHLNDYAEYIISIKNTSDEEQTISSISDNNANDYISYEYDDCAGIKLAANEILDLTVKAIYRNEISDISERAQDFSFALTINFSDKSETIAINPTTGDDIVWHLVIFSCAGLMLLLAAFAIKKHRKGMTAVMTIALVSILMPAVARAAAILSVNLTIVNEYKIEDRYDVSFDDADVDSQIIVYDGKVMKPEDPKKDFHDFIGWFADETLTTEFDFDNTSVTSDAKIYAKWREYDAVFDQALTNSSLKTVARRTRLDKAFREYEAQPTEAQLANALNVSATGDPIYVWDEGENVYWWSPDDRPKLKEVHQIFGDSITGLTTYYLTGFDTSELTSMASMFLNSASTRSIVFGDDFDTSNVKSMETTFANNLDLTNLSFGEKFTTENVENMRSIFMHTASMTEYDLSSFDTGNVTDMAFMFDNCEHLTKITFGEKFSTAKVTTMESMFSNMDNLEAVDLGGFDTSKVKTMKQMFYKNKKLKKVDLRSFNPHLVEDIDNMFSESPSIEEIMFPELFDLSKLRNAVSPFLKLTSLKSIDFSSWKTTSTLGHMTSFIAYNDSLESITFGPNFDTSGVYYMSGVFFRNKALKKIDLSAWDTRRAYQLHNFFSGCEKLEEVVLGEKFQFNNANSIDGMFYNAYKLKRIYASGNLNIPESLRSKTLFNSNTELVGGQGTAYSNEHKTAEYARIDNPDESEPGYFTNISERPVEP